MRDPAREQEGAACAGAEVAASVLMGAPLPRPPRPARRVPCSRRGPRGRSVRGGGRLLGQTCPPHRDRAQCVVGLTMDQAKAASPTWGCGTNSSCANPGRGLLEPRRLPNPAPRAGGFPWRARASARLSSAGDPSGFLPRPSGNLGRPPRPSRVLPDLEAAGAASDEELGRAPLSLLRPSQRRG